jgi:hypothetical protein
MFGIKDSWVDWHLIPSSRPVFNPPTPKTKFIDIPGGDGQLDLTTSLTGDTVYQNRTGSFEFIVDNGHQEWFTLYSDIMDYLHGKLQRATLEDEPTFYYEGRFSVNKWKSDPHNSKIVIDYNVSPYKYEMHSSLEDWVWDTFNFETGIVREYKDLRVDGRLDFIIVGRRMRVTPSFIVKSDDGTGMKVKFNGVTYDLHDGSSRVINIQTVEGENKLTFTGNGTVSIEYRGGRL